MAKRLIKVAKDLNVGISTLVEHLQKQGFKVENSPRAKVSEEAYEVLLRDFEKSIAIKTRADNLTIGSHIKKKEAERKEELEKERKKREEEARIRKEEEERKKREEEKRLEKELERLKREAAEEQARIQREKERAAAEEARKQKEREEAKKKLNIVGKVNLDEINRPRSKKVKPKRRPTNPAANAEVNEPKKEKQEIIKNKVEQPQSKPPVKEDESTTNKNMAETEVPAEVIRAEAPQLKGLKIKGKIDLNRFKKPKKKRKTKEEENKERQAKSNTNRPKSKEGEKKEGDSENRRRRKRRRKKVVKPPNTNTNNSNSNSTDKKTTDNKSGSSDKKTTTNDRNKSNSGNNNRRSRSNNNNNSQQGQGRRRERPKRNVNRRNTAKKEEPKEVSQKEIQDKIKATMARIAGGGKNKRQRVRRSNREQKREQQEKREEQEQTEVIQVTEFISVSELASLFDIAVTDIIMTCMNAGIIVSINQRLDAEVIELIAEEHGHEVEFISAEEQIDEEEEEVDDPKDLKPRAPIVTVMGHVDHGKTSLLDYIRKANVADGEAGGITQHIGAYEVRVNDSKVTFLDTPGHEAFTAMRARGAKVTDVAVIIVAADDSVMPQTKEAISHAQAAGVPIVFAINKIDKPGANPEKIKEQLAAMNFLVEDWGGKYQSQDISAKKGLGIEDLLEKIQLEAEILELQANPDKNSSGVILEASLDKGRGYVAKMLVQAGTLKVGDPIVAGEHAGKVKAMFNERGKRVKKVGPSTPVLVLGLSGAPQAGERFKVMDSEQETKALANKRSQINREQQQRATRRLTLDDLGRRIKLGNFQQLNLIVKGDVDGSIEALSDALLGLSTEEIQINIVHKGVGAISEADVNLA